jgi:hypothetical protein
MAHIAERHTRAVDQERERVNFALWRDSPGYWSVCDGPGLQNVEGHVFQRPDMRWAVEGDESGQIFLDEMSAASAVLQHELPPGIHFYQLKREAEKASVVTYPEVLDRIKAEGWTVVTVSRPLS